MREEAADDCSDAPTSSLLYAQHAPPSARTNAPERERETHTHRQTQTNREREREHEFCVAEAV